MLSFALSATTMVDKSQPRFNSDSRRHGNGGGLDSALDIMKSGITCSRGLQLKANAHELEKKNGPVEVSDVDSFGLGTTTTVNGRVFSQKFCIRSYEIGADGTETVETVMNHLQETALNHVKHVGLLSDDFGSTPEMRKMDLFWVVTKMQVLAIRYPIWDDVVQVDTWVTASGKNGMRRDWTISDCKTGEIITKASSNWVMMNKLTRKLSKFPDQVRAEIERYFVDTPPLIEDDNRKLPKLVESTADLVHNGLTPNWTDLDVNQHVNNVKYVGWILEGAPQQVMENYELASMTLEYRRECKLDSVLQLLTSSVENGNDEAKHAYFQHLLRLEAGGGEIVKGRTKWRPKSANLSQGHSPHVPD